MLTTLIGLTGMPTMEELTAATAAAASAAAPATFALGAAAAAALAVGTLALASNRHTASKADRLIARQQPPSLRRSSFSYSASPTPASGDDDDDTDRQSTSLGSDASDLSARSDHAEGSRSSTNEPTDGATPGPGSSPHGDASDMAAPTPSTDDHTHARVMSSSASASSSTPPLALIVVDALSTGMNVADSALRRGCLVISVRSSDVDLGDLVPMDTKLRMDYFARLRWDEKNPSAILADLRALPVRLIGVVAGCELGIACGDFLSEQLGLPSNGTAGSDVRRDKYLMQEAIRARGIRAPKQACATRWEEVATFLRGVPFPVVLKPSRSAGSDHIYKVTSVDSARVAFESILGERNVFGCTNTTVVCQEFLAGKEYVCDTVSKDGVHKVVALWEYDKHSLTTVDPVTGLAETHDFIYHGQSTLSGASPIGQALCAYALQVLDAVGIRHGAAHAEVIMTPSGPCLVEIGARPHGCEGTFMPVADRCWGYNQVDALISSILPPSLMAPATTPTTEATTATSEATAAASSSLVDFDALPAYCGDELEFGFKVDFVCAASGRLKAIDHLPLLSSLPSFFGFDFLPVVGSRMRVTVDLFTACGSMSLVHRDKEQLEKDLRRVREIEQTMWIVEPIEDEADQQTTQATAATTAV